MRKLAERDRVEFELREGGMLPEAIHVSALESKRERSLRDESSE
jgi:hypothetical protein